MAWIYFFPDEIEIDFARGLVGFGFSWAVTEIEKKKDMEKK